MNFTFGCDPEFILTKNAEIVSAIPLLPAKNKAIEIDGSFFYHDNVLAEIAIKPSSNKFELIENVKNALKNLCSLIEPVKISNKVCQEFPNKELTPINSRIATYNPEYDVYDLHEILPPNNLIKLKEDYFEYKTKMRTAGGHIHLGSDFLFENYNSIMVIKMMDLFVAIPSLFIDSQENSKQRRTMYGKAGSHRVPDHGVEYRVLSNFWLTSPQHAGLIFDLCQFTMEFVNERKYEKFWTIESDIFESPRPVDAFNCFGYDAERLIECINTCNQKEAEKFMYFIANYLPASLYETICEVQTLQNTDIYENWSL
jgi:hypothetical protein